MDPLSSVSVTIIASACAGAIIVAAALIVGFRMGRAAIVVAPVQVTAHAPVQMPTAAAIAAEIMRMPPEPTPLPAGEFTGLVAHPRAPITLVEDEAAPSDPRRYYAGPGRRGVDWGPLMYEGDDSDAWMAKWIEIDHQPDRYPDRECWDGELRRWPPVEPPVPAAVASEMPDEAVS